MKRFLLLLLLVTISCGSYRTTMQTVSSELMQTLNLTALSEISITTISEDRAYMLPVDPLFTSLQKELQKKIERADFTPIGGGGKGALVDMVRSSNGTYSLGIEESEVDSLILMGKYLIDTTNIKRVYCAISLFDLSGTTRFQKTIALQKGDVPPELEVKLFNILSHKEKRKEVIYKGFVIEKLDKLFERNGELLSYPPLYDLHLENPYALLWQVDLLKEILSTRYGIRFQKNHKNSIRLGQNRSITFTYKKGSLSIDNICEGEPLFDDDFVDASQGYRYPSSGAEQHFEEKKFKTSFEKGVRDTILNLFNNSYPHWFDPFDYQKLSSIFPKSNEKAILVGKKLAIDPSTGVEKIGYAWKSAPQWLKALKNSSTQKQRRFLLNTDVMKIFQDPSSDYRFWAIIRQKWFTTDLSGKIVYSDEGFLFVNFDFGEKGNLNHFQIYYRLWFYDYQYDHIIDGRIIATRDQKLKKDLEYHFQKRLTGIDAALKQDMVTYIVDQMQFVGGKRRR